MPKLIGVQGRDVADFMTVIQATPLHYVVEEKMEARNRNQATLTVTYCPTLAALEKGRCRERHPPLQTGVLCHTGHTRQAVQSGDGGQMPDHASQEGQAGHLLSLGVQDTLKRINMACFVINGRSCRRTPNRLRSLSPESAGSVKTELQPAVRESAR